MAQPTLFIADLHLSDCDDEPYIRFKKFIDNKARDARALYILGDLFEYYLGDDAISGVAKQVSDDINNLIHQHKTPCYFMAGNRDFLLSSNFAKLEILNDPTVVTLGEHKVILTHADALCTDDIEYQKIRQQLRSPQWQQQFLAQSIPQRIAFAKQARVQSQQYVQSANTDIMDVNQQAVNNLFKKFNVRYMIHGHTHRPAFHTHNINNIQHQRMVLGDWHYQTSYIEYRNNNFQLLTC